MNVFLVLLVVAVVITAITTKVKEYVDDIKTYVKDKTLKPSLYIALVLGIASGLTLQIGLVSTILDVVQIEYSLPVYFGYVDVFFSCIALASGSGWFIDLIKSIREGQKKINEELGK